MIDLKTRVPPPVVTLAVGALMWFGADATPGATVAFQGQAAVAGVIGAAGSALMLIAVVSMLRRKTTIDPLNPARARQLVTTGLFAYSRNPIYLGDFLLLLALAVWLGNVVALAIAPLLVWYLNAFQIAPEEAALAARFGDEFREYCARVRRWI